MRPIDSFGFVDWFILAVGAWLIVQGLRGAWRREIHMFGHVRGRSFSNVVRGPWAVAAGLAWAISGVVAIVTHFYRFG